MVFLDLFRSFCFFVFSLFVFDVALVAKASMSVRKVRDDVFSKIMKGEIGEQKTKIFQEQNNSRLVLSLTNDFYNPNMNTLH